MARTVDEQHRAELLERAVAYVLDNGIAELSLRPLARAVGASPRVLLYYFKSKDELLVAIIERARERQRGAFAQLVADDSMSPREVCRAIWRVMSAPKAEPAFRLSFEIYALSLQNRKRFRHFLDSVVEDWIAFMQPALLRAGYSVADARAVATVTIAGFRGFMLDLCATRDRERVNRAVELWLEALAAIPPPKSLAGAPAKTA